MTNRSASIEQALELPLEYPIYCHRNALASLASVVGEVAPAHRIAIISDESVAAHYAERALHQFGSEQAKLFTIPPGEHEKTRERWSELTDALLTWGAGRDTTIVALGGGVIGDLAGFVAATYMRGLSFVQVPTTLLAMVDASVGGKTAVDTPSGKNLVGAFHNPAAVIIDPDLLRTLSVAQFRSGLAEMLKHGIIADKSYLSAMLAALPTLLQEGGAAHQLPELIAGSVRIKAKVVAEDHKEGGLRQILNFGHTIAHAVEKLKHYQMLHGDAVAMGMVAEARIAEHLGVAQSGLSETIREAVEAAALPTELPSDLSLDEIIAETAGDKKSRAGTARYALPSALGEMAANEGRWSIPVADHQVRVALS